MKKIRKFDATFVSSMKAIDDIADSGDVILLGDVTLGEFLAHKEESQIKGNDESNFYVQKPRVASSLLRQFRTRETDSFNVYVDREIYDLLLSRGIHKTRIKIGFDAVLNFIKLKCFRKEGVILCTSYYKGNSDDAASAVLVEEFSFSNGALTGFTEKRYNTSVAQSEIARGAAESLKRLGEGNKQVLYVCGPASNDVIGYLDNLNPICLDVFANFQSSVATSQKRAEPSWPFISITVVSAAVSAGLILYGKSLYYSQVDQYNATIAGNESIYAMGNAPIELLEQRALLLKELEVNRQENFKLPVIINAISKVKYAMPEINLVAKRVSYFSNELLATSQQKLSYDYEIELQFNKLEAATPEINLEQWQNVFNRFSREIKGSSNVLSSPIEVKTADNKDALLMTITGKF